jgi:uncharacterized protein (DUF2147 family)
MRHLSLFFVAFLASSVLALGNASADPIGEWRVGDGNATVRIGKCGSALCGVVASTRSPPGRDYKNPDPSKRNRSVLGIQVLSNMKPAGANTWTGASYNAEDGQTYAARMTMQGDRTLSLQGCVPNGGLCGSETWTKVR